VLIHVTRLTQYPVKGFTGADLPRVQLVAGDHFPGDRMFAIENGPSGFDPAAPVHQPKFKFLVLMRMPALARLTGRYDAATNRFTLLQGDREVAAGELTTSEGRKTIEDYLAATLAGELRGPPRILTAPPGFRFMDSQSGYISILNLASLRAIAARAGRTILAPERFRANIITDGLPPWGEFDLIGKTIRIGDVTLRMIKRIDRCAATHVDPVRGIRDLDLVGLLEREFGHHDCGVYAEVVTGGLVSVGDRILA